MGRARQEAGNTYTYSYKTNPVRFGDYREKESITVTVTGPKGFKESDTVMVLRRPETKKGWLFPRYTYDVSHYRNSPVIDAVSSKTRIGANRQAAEVVTRRILSSKKIGG